MRGFLSGRQHRHTRTVAGIEELYQQLLPTKVYNNRKTGTSSSGDQRCRLCGNEAESVSHILAGCSALAQTKYLERLNHALNILFLEVLRSLNLTEKSSPWYSPIKPKPVYENEQAVAYWDVPLFADQTTVSANRIDVTVVGKVKKEVLLIEMMCPWVENREKKSAEKTSKHGPLRWELQVCYPGCCVKQYNIVIDVLGGYSRDVSQALRDLVGEASSKVARRMQKSVITSTLHIARYVKIIQS